MTLAAGVRRRRGSRRGAGLADVAARDPIGSIPGENEPEEIATTTIIAAAHPA
jgi:hypothetical protein